MNDQAQQLRSAARARNIAGPPPRRRAGGTACRVLTVASGKGGVGKTSLVINLALALSRFGYRVVIIDADLGLANIDVMLNAVPGHNLGDVIDGRKKLSEIVMTGPLDIKVVPGGSGLFELANLDQSRRRAVLEQLGDLETEADFMIIDTAAGISRNVIDFIGAADELVLVTTPEPPALTDAYGVMKVTAERGLKVKCYLVVNATRGIEQGRKTYAGLNRVVQRYLPGMELVYLGDICFDRAVSGAVHDFSPLVISRPRAAASEAINRIAWRIASSGRSCDGPRDAGKSFFNRLKRMRSQ